MKLVIVYLLVGVVFAHNVYENLNALEEKYGPLTFFSNKNQTSPCDGQQSGAFCDLKDCKKLIICIPGGEVIEGTCNSTQYCNDGKCTNEPSALCDEYNGVEFKCSQEGVYPDPSSCQSYNYCVPVPLVEGTPRPPPVRTPEKCIGDWAYNPATTLCDKPLPSKKCTLADRVVPKCDKERQEGALKASSSYYYICAERNNAKGEKVLYPNIYRCPNNQKYIGNFQRGK